MENMQIQMNTGIEMPVATNIGRVNTGETTSEGSRFLETTNMFDDTINEANELRSVRDELDLIAYGEEFADCEIFDAMEHSEKSTKLDGVSGDDEPDVLELKIDEKEPETKSEPMGLEEKMEKIGQAINEVKESVERIEASGITKEELVAALLVMYEMSKSEKEEDKVGLFELLVIAMTRMLIELTTDGSEPSRKEQAGRVKANGRKRMDIDKFREVLANKIRIPAVENKAA